MKRVSGNNKSVNKLPTMEVATNIFESLCPTKVTSSHNIAASLKDDIKPININVLENSIGIIQKSNLSHITDFKISPNKSSSMNI